VKGLDTNVLVRFLVRDDRRQARSAAAFIHDNCTSETPCWINRIVLCELEWVLESAYGYPRRTVAEVIEKILRTGEFAIEDGDAARFAHRAYADGSADFADCLLAQTNLARGCDSTATFDRKAGRTAGFETIEAEPS
jgi:predicted nucleic-acid-binding protein